MKQKYLEFLELENWNIANYLLQLNFKIMKNVTFLKR